MHQGQAKPVSNRTERHAPLGYYGEFTALSALRYCLQLVLASGRARPSGRTARRRLPASPHSASRGTA